MIRALNTGVLGMRQFQTSLDVIGNNLANINTVAYKGARVEFRIPFPRPFVPNARHRHHFWCSGYAGRQRHGCVRHQEHLYPGCHEKHWRAH